MELTLVDISKYQKKINYDKLVTEAQAVIMRSSFGVTKDPYFERNWSECTARNIPKGVYHYFTSTMSGAKQAEFVVSILLNQCPQLKLWLDGESRSVLVTKSQLEERYCDFLLVYERLTGTRSGIYTGPSFWNDNVPRNDWAKDYLLWIANYGVKVPAIPEDWKSHNRTWTFWQYSAGGNLQGKRFGVESMDIDLDKYNGTVVEFNAQFGTTLPVPITPPSGDIIPMLPHTLKFMPGMRMINIRLEPSATAADIGDLMSIGNPIAFEDLPDKVGNRWCRIGENMYIARIFNGVKLLAYK